MKYLFLIIVLTFSLLSSCSAELPENDQKSSGATESNGFQTVTTQKMNVGSVEYFSIPTTDCSMVTSSPIVVDNYLIFSLHESGRGDCRGAQSSGWLDFLLAYHIEDEAIYAIADIDSAEGTVTYLEEKELLFQPTLHSGSGPFAILDATSFSVLYPSVAQNIRAAVDTSGLWLDDSFYFGTVNPAEVTCQDPINNWCGSFYKITESGVIEEKIDIEQGYRAWLVGSPTSNGEDIFIATAKQAYGEIGEYDFEAQDYYYGCSQLKLDKDLNILATHDPGTVGCRAVSDKLLSVMVGEMSLSPTSAWAQLDGPDTNSGMTAVIQYDLDLNEICRAEVASADHFTVAAFYQSPTIDKDGNAYVTYTLPVNGMSTNGFLYKINPECELTLLAQNENSAKASATLADDKYVLFVTDGLLEIYTMQGDLYQYYELGSGAQTKSSPVIHEGIIYILQTDGTLNIIKGSGLQNYGSAHWPRFRHDNYGTATLER